MNRTGPVFILALLAPCAPAADFYVTHNGDSIGGDCSSSCSLREAVQQANENPGSDNIIIPEGTYSLKLEGADEDQNQTGDLDIRGNVVLSAENNGDVIIKGRYDRVLDIHNGNVTLNHIIVRDGRASDRGAGILNRGTLTLKSSQVIWNMLTADQSGSQPVQGAGIASYGTLKVVSSQIKYNTLINRFSSQTARGAAIYTTGEAYLYDSEIHQNTIRNLGSSYGSTASEGGGIYNSGELYASHCIFRNNQASASGWARGGGIYNTGNAEIKRSFFYANNTSSDSVNRGAALMNDRGGTVRLETSLITKNSADIPESTGSGSSLLENSVVENRSRSSASEDSYMKMVNVTLVSNSGAGYVSSGSSRIYNTIIARNKTESSALSSWSNCLSAGSSSFIQSHLLLGDTSDSSCSSDLSSDDSDIFTTLLIKAGNNQFFPFYYRPRGGSEAVDGGSHVCPERDMLNHLMDNDGNSDGVSACDLGAVEYP